MAPTLFHHDIQLTERADEAVDSLVSAYIELTRQGDHTSRVAWRRLLWSALSVARIARRADRSCRRLRLLDAALRPSR